MCWSETLPRNETATTAIAIETVKSLVSSNNGAQMILLLLAKRHTTKKARKTTRHTIMKIKKIRDTET